MTRKMNIGLQKYQLKKKLEKAGVPSDVVDIAKKGELDPTLHLDEQITQFKQKYPGLFSKKKGVDKGKVKSQRHRHVKDEATSMHRKRPPWDRRMDESIQAQRVVKKTEKGLSKWAHNSDQMDMKGVDTKRPKKDRTRAKKPRSKTKKYKNLFKLARAGKEVKI